MLDIILSLFNKLGALGFLVPLIGFFGWIWKMKADNDKLKNEVATEEARKASEKAVTEFERIEKDADAKEAEFRAALDKYRKSDHESGRML